MLEQVLKLLQENSGFATLVSFATAIALLKYKQFENKRNVATAILQEIRRAEALISTCKASGEFKLAEKIIQNNSWKHNVSLFVKDFSIDELDRITELYSKSEHLDWLILKIAEYKFHQNITAPTQGIPLSPIVFPSQADAVQNPESQNSPVLRLPLVGQSPNETMILPLVNLYEPIYYSSICEKLRRIAGVI